MVTSTSKLSKTAGTHPGTLIYTGDKTQFNTEIELIQYNESSYFRLKGNDAAQILEQVKQGMVNWINISGFNDLSAIELIGNHFNIHPLHQEDICNSEQLPKVEDNDDYLFLTLKILEYNLEKDAIEPEHISFVLGQDFIMSFQEKPGDSFDVIRARIKNCEGKICNRKADYLLYRLIDNIVDTYYLILETLEESIERLEDDIIHKPSGEMAEIILGHKKKLIFLKRTIFPFTEEFRKLIMEETALINPKTYTYFSDVYDHLSHFVQSIESYRETIGSLMDLHVSNNAYRMNNIMMTLTIIATIFIPLTWVAGIYGMNFQFMPELSWKYGYPVIVFIMVAIGTVMYFFMKRKKWF
jgi:magnesium transporter